METHSSHRLEDRRSTSYKVLRVICGYTANVVVNVLQTRSVHCACANILNYNFQPHSTIVIIIVHMHIGTVCTKRNLYIVIKFRVSYSRAWNCWNTSRSCGSTSTVNTVSSSRAAILDRVAWFCGGWGVCGRGVGSHLVG